MIDTHLITGRLGSGKTSLLIHLLDNKPAAERWGIVINEFGQTGLDAAFVTTDTLENSEIIEINGGCICCATRSQLHVQLTHLIRQFRPDRIMIEATGLGHPAGIIDLLRSKYFKDIIRLHSVISVVDTSLFEESQLHGDRSPVSTESFTQQAELANIIILNKTDLASEGAIENAYRYFSSLYPAKLSIIQTEQSIVNISLLEVEIIFSDVNQHTHKDSNTIIHSEHKNFSMTDGKATFTLEEYNNLISLGFIFPSGNVFSRQKLIKLIDDLLEDTEYQLIRLKAVFNCGRFWYSFNATDRQQTINESSYRRDSRIEIISENKKLSIEEIQSALFNCLQENY